MRENLPFVFVKLFYETRMDDCLRIETDGRFSARPGRDAHKRRESSIRLFRRKLPAPALMALPAPGLFQRTGRDQRWQRSASEEERLR